MKFNVIGRLNNMQLLGADSELLYSIYEAVSNAIHAVEERFGADHFAKRGRIHLVVKFHEDKRLNYIAISDNGIGLNESHLLAFETCDTQQKSNIGGKGIGRLVWNKAFSNIDVRSGYEHGLDQYHVVSFKFVPEEDDSLVELRRVAGTPDDVGTKIILSSPKPEINLGLTRKSLIKELCYHFFPFIIAGSSPEITIEYGRRHIDIVSYINERVETKLTETVDLTENGLGILSVSHVYVDKIVSQRFSNSILLAAQHRVVISTEIEQKFALGGLANGKAYVCVVSGAYLDKNVDQERTGFKGASSNIDLLREEVMRRVEAFLHDHISRIRIAQREIVIRLLEEHPQLAISVSSVDGYVSKLSPSMADEDIGKTLFTLLYRHEKKIKSQIERMESEETAELDIDSMATTVNALLQMVGDDAKRRLAEYTIKRHQIIQLARTLLRFTDSETRKHHVERTVHEIICPMGKMLSSKDYNDHNLWLIDDLLSYYSFFASDKPLQSIGIDGERKEPDIIFFNPYGFRREGTDDPIIIVEFKRPGDEYLSSDPIEQVLDYIERLRNKTVKNQDGEVVSNIKDYTPFECIVICDLTEGARKKLRKTLAQNPTPDGLGYYGFSPEHRASIRVLSYQKLFRDAELRNKSFFDRLGLLPEEVRKALSSAAHVAERAPAIGDPGLPEEAVTHA